MLDIVHVFLTRFWSLSIAGT